MGFEWVPLKNYKRHFICLDCQKGFKRPSKEDMKHPKSADFSKLMDDYYAAHSQEDIVEYIRTAYKKIEIPCPQCQSPMLQVHYDFEVPPTRNDRAWKKLKETMAAKMSSSYSTYIHWHKLALQRVVQNSEEYKILSQNMIKLQKLEG